MSNTNMPSAVEECCKPSANFTLSGEWSLRILCSCCCVFLLQLHQKSASFLKLLLVGHLDSRNTAGAIQRFLWHLEYHWWTRVDLATTTFNDVSVGELALDQSKIHISHYFHFHRRYGIVCLLSVFCLHFLRSSASDACRCRHFLSHCQQLLSMSSSSRSSAFYLINQVFFL